ncbi:hypothetical protein [Pelagibius sp.]|uniref:hypothetical protein n=1 Tax=Pelagibius sp. TaxID=1931238 RepID=UPI003BAFD119
MRNVHLYGHLAEKYGDCFQLAVDSPNAAVRLLIANFPSFRHDIADGYYRVVRGDPDTGFPLPPEMLHMPLGSNDLHIIPVAAGAKEGGIGKAILGAIILVAAVALAPATGGASAAGAGAAGGAAAGSAAATGLAAPAFILPVFGTAITYGNIALFGAALALGGITQLLSPQPSAGDYSEREAPDQRPSFISNGPVNTTEQGGIRPLVFGRFLVGSVVISGGLAVEQI